MAANPFGAAFGAAAAPAPAANNPFGAAAAPAPPANNPFGAAAAPAAPPAGNPFGAAAAPAPAAPFGAAAAPAAPVFGAPAPQPGAPAAPAAPAPPSAATIALMNLVALSRTVHQGVSAGWMTEAAMKDFQTGMIAPFQTYAGQPVDGGGPMVAAAHRTAALAWSHLIEVIPSLVESPPEDAANSSASPARKPSSLAVAATTMMPSLLGHIIEYLSTPLPQLAAVYGASAPVAQGAVATTVVPPAVTEQSLLMAAELKLLVSELLFFITSAVWVQEVTVVKLFGLINTLLTHHTLLINAAEGTLTVPVATAAPAVPAMGMFGAAAATAPAAGGQPSVIAGFASAAAFTTTAVHRANATTMYYVMTSLTSALSAAPMMPLRTSSASNPGTSTTTNPLTAVPSIAKSVADQLALSKDLFDTNSPLWNTGSTSDATVSQLIGILKSTKCTVTPMAGRLLSVIGLCVGTFVAQSGDYDNGIEIALTAVRPPPQMHGTHSSVVHATKRVISKKPSLGYGKAFKRIVSLMHNIVGQDTSLATATTVADSPTVEARQGMPPSLPGRVPMWMIARHWMGVVRYLIEHMLPLLHHCSALDVESYRLMTAQQQSAATLMNDARSQTAQPYNQGSIVMQPSYMGMGAWQQQQQQGGNPRMGGMNLAPQDPLAQEKQLLEVLGAASGTFVIVHFFDLIGFAASLLPREYTSTPFNAARLAGQIALRLRSAGTDALEAGSTVQDEEPLSCVGHFALKCATLHLRNVFEVTNAVQSPFSSSSKAATEGGPGSVMQALKQLVAPSSFQYKVMASYLRLLHTLTRSGADARMIVTQLLHNTDAPEVTWSTIFTLVRQGLHGGVATTTAPSTFRNGANDGTNWARQGGSMPMVPTALMASSVNRQLRWNYRNDKTSTLATACLLLVERLEVCLPGCFSDNIGGGGAQSLSTMIFGTGGASTDVSTLNTGRAAPPSAAPPLRDDVLGAFMAAMSVLPGDAAQDVLGGFEWLEASGLFRSFSNSARQQATATNEDLSDSRWFCPDRSSMLIIQQQQDTAVSNANGTPEQHSDISTLLASEARHGASTSLTRGTLKLLLSRFHFYGPQSIFSTTRYLLIFAVDVAFGRYAPALASSLQHVAVSPLATLADDGRWNVVALAATLARRSIGPAAWLLTTPSSATAGVPAGNAAWNTGVPAGPAISNDIADYNDTLFHQVLQVSRAPRDVLGYILAILESVVRATRHSYEYQGVAPLSRPAVASCVDALMMLLATILDTMSIRALSTTSSASPPFTITARTLESVDFGWLMLNIAAIAKAETATFAIKILSNMSPSVTSATVRMAVMAVTSQQQTQSANGGGNAALGIVSQIIQRLRDALQYRGKGSSADGEAAAEGDEVDAAVNRFFFDDAEYESLLGAGSNTAAVGFPGASNPAAVIMSTTSTLRQLYTELSADSDDLFLQRTRLLPPSGGNAQETLRDAVIQLLIRGVHEQIPQSLTSLLCGFTLDLSSLHPPGPQRQSAATMSCFRPILDALQDDEFLKQHPLPAAAFGKLAYLLRSEQQKQFGSVAASLGAVDYNSVYHHQQTVVDPSGQSVTTFSSGQYGNPSKAHAAGSTSYALVFGSTDALGDFEHAVDVLSGRWGSTDASGALQSNAFYSIAYTLRSLAMMAFGLPNLSPSGSSKSTTSRPLPTTGLSGFGADGADISTLGEMTRTAVRKLVSPLPGDGKAQTAGQVPLCHGLLRAMDSICDLPDVEPLQRLLIAHSNSAAPGTANGAGMTIPRTGMQAAMTMQAVMLTAANTSYMTHHGALKRALTRTLGSGPQGSRKNGFHNYQQPAHRPQHHVAGASTAAMAAKLAATSTANCATEAVRSGLYFTTDDGDDAVPQYDIGCLICALEPLLWAEFQQSNRPATSPLPQQTAGGRPIWQGMTAAAQPPTPSPSQGPEFVNHRMRCLLSPAIRGNTAMKEHFRLIAFIEAWCEVVDVLCVHNLPSKAAMAASNDNSPLAAMIMPPSVLHLLAMTITTALDRLHAKASSMAIPVVQAMVGPLCKSLQMVVSALKEQHIFLSTFATSTQIHQSPRGARSSGVASTLLAGPEISVLLRGILQALLHNPVVIAAPVRSALFTCLLELLCSRTTAGTPIWAIDETVLCRSSYAQLCDLARTLSLGTGGPAHLVVSLRAFQSCLLIGPSVVAAAVGANDESSDALGSMNASVPSSSRVSAALASFVTQGIVRCDSYLEGAFGAAAMSRITGSNEGYAGLQDAHVAVLLWEGLFDVLSTLIRHSAAGAGSTSSLSMALQSAGMLEALGNMKSLESLRNHLSSSASTIAVAAHRAATASSVMPTTAMDSLALTFGVLAQRALASLFGFLGIFASATIHRGSIDMLSQLLLRQQPLLSVIFNGVQLAAVATISTLSTVKKAHQHHLRTRQQQQALAWQQQEQQMLMDNRFGNSGGYAPGPYSPAADVLSTIGPEASSTLYQFFSIVDEHIGLSTGSTSLPHASVVLAESVVGLIALLAGASSSGRDAWDTPDRHSKTSSNASTEPSQLLAIQFASDPLWNASSLVSLTSSGVLATVAMLILSPFAPHRMPNSNAYGSHGQAGRDEAGAGTTRMLGDNSGSNGAQQSTHYLLADLLSFLSIDSDSGAATMVASTAATQARMMHRRNVARLRFVLQHATLLQYILQLFVQGLMVTAARGGNHAPNTACIDAVLTIFTELQQTSLATTATVANLYAAVTSHPACQADKDGNTPSAVQPFLLLLAQIAEFLRAASECATVFLSVVISNTASMAALTEDRKLAIRQALQELHAATAQQAPGSSNGVPSAGGAAAATKSGTSCAVSLAGNVPVMATLYDQYMGGGQLTARQQPASAPAPVNTTGLLLANLRRLIQ